MGKNALGTLQTADRRLCGLPTAGRLSAFARIIPFLEIKTLIIFSQRRRDAKKKLAPSQNATGEAGRLFAAFLLCETYYFFSRKDAKAQRKRTSYSSSTINPIPHHSGVDQSHPQGHRRLWLVCHPLDKLCNNRSSDPQNKTRFFQTIPLFRH